MHGLILQLTPSPLSGAGHSRAPSAPPPPPDSGSSFILPPSSFPPLSPSLPPHSVSPSLRLSVSPPLSPDDERRLLTLSDPTLSPLQLAAWLAQPHIQQALEALEHLRALQRQRYHEQVAQEAIHTLRELSKTTDDPIERRRAATTILRALTRSASLSRPRRERAGERAPSSPSPPTLDSPQPIHPPTPLPASPSGSSFILPPSSFPSSDRLTRDHTQTRPRSASEGLPTPTPPRGGGQAHAQREPGGGASPASISPLADSPPAASPPPPLLPSPQDSGLRTQDSPPASPSGSSFILPPSSFPSSARLTPDTLTAELTTRLRALDAPTPESVRTTIWEGLDIKVWRDPKRSLDLSARIADGPLCDPTLRATTPTVEHIDTTEATATRRLRWPDTALLLHLVYDDGDNASFFPRHWTLADITTDHDPPNSS